MIPYTILICDDDEIFAKKVKEIILAYHKHCSVDIKNDETISYDELYDAYFLDIEMPTKNGFEVAKNIHQRHKGALLIFLTTHEELSMIGYEYQAFRFISKERIVQMFPKALEDLFHKLDEVHQNIEVKNNEVIQRLYLNDIAYFYSENNYLNFRIGKETFRKRFSIKEFQDNFHNQYFVCPQVGYMVNLHHIQSIDRKGKLILMDNGDKLNLSRKFKDSFLKEYYHSSL